MLYIGLTSVTFRTLNPEAVIEIARRSGVDGIEWGGDVHVPPGDLELAREVRSKTLAAGLSVCSYGSYYRANAESGDFADVLATARELGAPILRIWAGRKASANASAADRAAVVEHIRRAVIAATEFDITIGLEYHRGTLTDTQASAQQLLEEVALPELKLYWQPRTGGTLDGDLPELEAALPHLAHIHVFHWVQEADGTIDRRPFREGLDAWREYLARIRRAEGAPYLIFEFVRASEPAQLMEDCRALRSLLLETPPN